MDIKLEFESKWFYISGITVAIILWLVLYYVNTLIGILLAPFLIVAGAYFAIVKAKAEKDKWYLVGNALFGYGTAAAFVNVLLFLAFFGPLIWDMLFKANRYIGAIGGLTVFVGALAVVTVFVYSFLGGIAAFILRRMKKE